MKLYRTTSSLILESEEKYYQLDETWDVLINRDGLYGYLAGLLSGLPELEADRVTALLGKELLAPIGSQEVWAAGVTYLRSREARMEESAASGGADFYDKVYVAERPELFFKALPHRVAAPFQAVYIRRDSSWNVPEPELTLYINSQAHIQGYTIGNDMSSRSIEGENPLYLPQAKVYDRSAALGPALYIPETPIPATTMIRMTIARKGEQVYSGEVAISQMKRKLEELAEWLFRETEFSVGCYLMTGTCLVPGNDFTLQPGDIVDITIGGIGTLTNPVKYRGA